MKLLATAVLFLLAGSSVLAQALTVTTSRERAAYEIGETVVFRVASDARGDLEYEISYAPDEGALASGTVRHDGGVTTVTYRADVPCFLHFRARLGGRETTAGAVVGRDEIGPLSEEPDDFDAFWRSQRAELDAIPLDLRSQLTSQNEYTATYEFSVASVDGRRVYGYYVLPKTDGVKPGLISLPPYGTGSIGPSQHTTERTNVIAVDVSIHNAPPGQSDQRAYRPNDLRDRETIYYRYGVIAAMRAVDVLGELPDWDGSNVVASGHSQGGGLAILAAGADPRVTHLFQSVAALAQHGAYLTGRASGFPRFLDKADDMYDGEGFREAQEAVGYYDVVHAARRFSGPSMHFVNYRDVTCPPATHYAAFNQMRGPRVAQHSLADGHDSAEEYEPMLLNFLRLHFEAARTPPWPWPDTEVAFGIDAGPDGATTAGAVSLDASASYDGQAGDSGWEVRWEKASGPGDVRFDDATALRTDAHFSTSGTYRLRLAVTAPHPSDDLKYYLLVDEVTVDASAAPLPAELTAFEASTEPTPTTLTWATDSELDVRHFRVERSGEGGAWATIGTVDAAGDSDAPRVYDYLDAAPPTGRSYYRLATVDEDGSEVMSHVVSVVVASAGPQLTLAPNPAAGSGSVRVGGVADGREVTVTDAVGRVLRREPLTDGALALGGLPAGVYFVSAGAYTARLLVE